MSHHENPPEIDGYEPPTITRLGSVAEFTRRDELALDFDGRIFRGPGVFSGGGS